MTDEPTDTDMKEDKQTLGEMSHTNPHTGRVFGDTQTYSRGNTVAADGGEANGGGPRGDERPGQSSGEAARRVSRPSSDAATSDGGEANVVDETGAADDESDRLEDVDHTPPGDADGAQAAYARGDQDE